MVNKHMVVYMYFVGLQDQYVITELLYNDHFKYRTTYQNQRYNLKQTGHYANKYCGRYK